MCIICIKDKGVNFPTIKEVENCWDANPDGAGYMIADGQHVWIKKGIMTKKEFIAEFNKLEKYKPCSVVFHFRIATHGGKSAKMTHPFPVTSSETLLKKTNVKASFGFVHNGIFSDLPAEKDMSDSAVLVRDYLSQIPMDKPKLVKRFLDNECGGYSKVALMDSAGTILTSGHFEKSNGLLWSNNSYRERTVIANIGGSRYNYGVRDYNTLWSQDDDYYGEPVATKPRTKTFELSRLPDCVTAFGPDGMSYYQGSAMLEKGEEFFIDEDSGLYFVDAEGHEDFIDFVTDEEGYPICAR